MMKQFPKIRGLALFALVGLLAACSQTYSYVPSVGQPAAIPPTGSAAAETPAGAPAPAPAPAPDLAKQVQTLELRVQQLESRLTEMEAQRAAPASAHRAREQKPTKIPAPSTSSYPPASGAGDKAYAEGFRLYQAKKYSSARSHFHKYLAANPQGSKAAEAHYYLADSFYHEAKYREAAAEFNKMASQYPKSILTPAAIMRQALSYKQQQQQAAYRSTLRKLIKNYPKSTEAKEAQKWLKEEKKEAAGSAPAKH
jgi:tol-pal system protein YbgF